MSLPVFDPEYWSHRLRESPRGQLHHAVFKCTGSQWSAIAAKHRSILMGHISPQDNILDVGCGWGRLLGLLPHHYRGNYVGIDLCSEFINLADRLYELSAGMPGGAGVHSSVRFVDGDVRHLETHLENHQRQPGYFDWAVFISIRPMVLRNVGKPAWDEIDVKVREFCKKLLFLEYDVNDPGSVE